MFLKLLFLESYVMQMACGKHCPLYHVVVWCSFFFLLAAWATCGGVTIIESSLGIKQGDTLRSPLFTLAHYRVFVKTITQVPSYAFPSLTNDTHILGFMSEINCAFDHLSTRLTLVGLKVKM